MPDMTAMRAAAAGRGPADHHRNGWATIGFMPIVVLLAGLVLVGASAIASQSLINTDASWLMQKGFGFAMTNKSGATLMPAFDVPTQIFYLLKGNMSAPQYESMFYAYIDWIVTTIVSLNIVSQVLFLANRSTGHAAGLSAGIAKRAWWRNNLFVAGTILLVIWNGYTTYNFGPGNDVGHAGFTLMVEIASLGFLPLGILCLKAAYSLWKHPLPQQRVVVRQQQ